MSIQHEDAAQIHGFGYVSNVDPGAVGPFRAWVRTSYSPARILIRNAANTAWQDLFIANDSWDRIQEMGDLTPAASDILQYVGGVWTNRTMSQLKTSLSLNNVPNVNATLRANHTGTQLAATISDLQTEVDARVAIAIAAEGFGDLAYQSAASAAITGGTIFSDDEGIGIKSSFGTKSLILKANEALNSADRILSIIVGDNNRTINLAGDLIVGVSGAEVVNTNTGDESQQTIGNLIGAATEKATPIDADKLGLADSTSSDIVRYLTWANLKKHVRASEVVTETSASTTMAVTRLGKTVRYTASGALDVTIPSTTTLGTNFLVKMFNHGDSNLTIIADGGVTLLGNTTLAVNKICTLEAITTNVYKISGETT